MVGCYHLQWGGFQAAPLFGVEVIMYSAINVRRESNVEKSEQKSLKGTV